MNFLRCAIADEQTKDACNIENFCPMMGAFTPAYGVGLMKIACGALLVQLASATALVAAADFSPGRVDGTYKSATTTLRALMLDPVTGQMAAETVVTVGACSGRVAGLGRLEGQILRFSPYKPAAESAGCTITVSFAANGKTATIEENRCMDYHGAACGWEGQSLRKIAGP